jgi:hypothetical protein
VEILYISLFTIIASGIGTLTGFGTSTILVPTLLLFYPLPLTLLLVGIIHWFGDIWKIILFKKGIRLSFVLAFGLPGIIATYLGARMVFGLPEASLSRIVGVFLLLYVLFLTLKPTFKLPKNNTISFVGGTLYGLSAGIFGIGGAIRGAFLAAFNLPKEVYIATAGAVGLAIDSVRVTTYFLEGARLSNNLFWGLLIFIPASFLGARIAKKLVDKISQENFRKVVAVFLAIVGALLMFNLS